MPLVDAPRPGFGTFQLEGASCAEMVETALDVGYRHVDTARMYGNEERVGEGLARSNVPREDVTVASKVWHDGLGYDDVVAAAHESRNRLGVDAIDIYYVHWPANTYDPSETLGAFSDLVQDGVIDAIGVSNFTADRLDEAIAVADAPIAVNQIEVHPGFPQQSLREHCDRRGVDVVAYSPLGHGMLLDSDPVREIADRHVVSPARVVLAWHLRRGVTPIPKAASWAHAVDNWRARDLVLTDEEVATISALEEPGRLGDPDFAPWN